MSAAGFVGASVKRLEDEALLTGRGPLRRRPRHARLLEAAFVRSPHPHARIVSVDAAAAREFPGVRAVFSHEDLAAVLTSNVIPSDHRTWDFPDTAQPLVLAEDESCYVGEPVAIVIADSRYTAEDAAAWWTSSTSRFPPSPTAGTRSPRGAPTAHREARDNVVKEIRTEYGDCDAAFASAPPRLLPLAQATPRGRALHRAARARRAPGSGDGPGDGVDLDPGAASDPQPARGAAGHRRAPGARHRTGRGRRFRRQEYPLCRRGGDRRRRLPARRAGQVDRGSPRALPRLDPGARPVLGPGGRDGRRGGACSGYGGGSSTIRAPGPCSRCTSRTIPRSRCRVRTCCRATGSTSSSWRRTRWGRSRYAARAIRRARSPWSACSTRWPGGSVWTVPRCAGAISSPAIGSPTSFP